MGVKPKRVRTIFTPEQLERLEQEFERQQYMVGTERYYLASSLNLSEAQVKVWFQNRRIKWRKQHLEGQGQPPQQQQHPLQHPFSLDAASSSSASGRIGGGLDERLNVTTEEDEEEEEVDLESDEDIRSLTSSSRSSPGILLSLAADQTGHPAAVSGYPAAISGHSSAHASISGHPSLGGLNIPAHSVRANLENAVQSQNRRDEEEGDRMRTPSMSRSDRSREEH